VLRGRSIPASREGPRLELTGETEVRTFRVIAPEAGTVEIVGDFTDWLPVALARKEGAVWEVSLRVSAGIHRMNLRLDRGPWIVPAGLRLEQNEFGGAVGLLVVP
jgi:1,4-alpha-glucan branching enzyme